MKPPNTVSTGIGSGSTPAQVRAAARSGAWTSHTSGLAERHVQGNLVILPQAQAGDFLRFCQRNPKPCPLLAVGEPGDPMLVADDELTLGALVALLSPAHKVGQRGRRS